MSILRTSKNLTNVRNGGTPVIIREAGQKNPAGPSCIRYCLLSYLKAELKNKEDRTCQKISRNGYGY